MSSTPLQLAARIARNSVKVESGCRLWTGAISKSRSGHYPRMTVRARGYPWPVLIYAHRVALELKLGRPIREGYEADHTCRNTLCVEGDHLQEVTEDENKRLARSRAATTEATHHDSL